ncbi:nucleoside triphosphate pyrophosphohydrolase [bacterium]|nr:nucleoside triphosphate pyrophosphohydrolase [candidate division CSSED10-310 bacterium]
MNDQSASVLFSELLDIIKALRSPSGCPWDRKQTHQSLISYMLEEAHEAVAAIESDDLTALAGELGDVLLQVVLHAEIASEARQRGEPHGFTISDVLTAINGKLRHRHPHVFGDVTVRCADEVADNWQSIKSREKRSPGAASILDDVPLALPQLLAAQKYQERAAQVGFDWDDIADVQAKITEEWNELLEVLNEDNASRIEEEYGDLLFALVNLARWLRINSEEALRKANRKFRIRFSQVETEVGGAEAMREKSLEELDLVWDQVKKNEKREAT